MDRYGLVGDAPYQVEIEGDETAPAPEPTPLPQVDPTPLPQPDFILSPEGATDKGALTLDEVTVDEIAAEDDVHSLSL